MDEAHKTALAEGRAQGAAVRAYIEALEANKPKRGRKRTKETVEAQLAEVNADLDGGKLSGMAKLEGIQSRRDLEKELAAFDNTVDLSGLEARFVEVAAGYGARKGIEYSTWREFGVPAATLKAAGISR